MNKLVWFQTVNAVISADGARLMASLFDKAIAAGDGDRYFPFLHRGKTADTYQSG